MKKAMELPASTIAIMILAVIVMAVIILFYLMYSGKIDISTSSLFSLNKSQKSCEQLLQFGGCPPGQCCIDGSCTIIGGPCPT